MEMKFIPVRGKFSFRPSDKSQDKRLLVVCQMWGNSPSIMFVEMYKTK